MHTKNPFNKRYDFETLTKSSPELKDHIVKNKNGDDTIDFDNPKSVKMLNYSLLKHFYGIKKWEFPESNLCPPIPNRADYLYWIDDLIGHKSDIRGLDIGVGANCIYPLIGYKAFGWSFVGSDISLSSINSAKKIIEDNSLSNWISPRLQKKKDSIFHSIIQKDENFEFTICNPPFHETLEEAQSATLRKRKNLGLSAGTKLNFGGESNELFCKGGEKEFIKRMIQESSHFSKQVKWFTTLVSKEKHLSYFEKILKGVNCSGIKIIPMNHGQKKSRILAWSF
jgi:23S rRNA (adenine1618-N6)-methyltransferase